MAFAWHRNRNQNTTEQKTWTAGQALDNLLAPAWRSPDALLELLTVTSAKAFTKALSAQKGFGGSLVFSHTLEYLQLWDSASMHPLFSCHLRKCIMSRYIRPGKNCQNYLDICNARSERGGTPGNYSLKNLSADVLDLLPKSVELVDGGVVEFPSRQMVSKTRARQSRWCRHWSHWHCMGTLYRLSAVASDPRLAPLSRSRDCP
jgi:hypothetical protein